MTRRSRRTARRPVRRRRSALAWWSAPGVIALVLVAGIALSATRERPAPPGDDGRDAVPNGEVNAMGLPVLATPGGSAGVAEAGSVQVDGANWEMGRVPLDVAVRPSWTLVNMGDRPITLGEPHAEVLAGCCPGALVLGTNDLSARARTTLSFELAMHEGMDGRHEMIVHVPVGSEVLSLGVTGDFR
jgi:hypothetical protein